MLDDKTNNILNSPVSLSESQIKAVISSAKHARVTAGAGSGKTETLTRRIVYLLLHEKVKPNEIVAFTFTDKAAQSMKSRIYEEIESLGGKEACLSLGDMYVGTIHGFCLRVLQNSVKYGDYEVFDENQEMAFLLKTGWQLGLNKEHYFDSCDNFLRSVNIVYDELLDPKRIEDKSPDFYKKLCAYEIVLSKNKRLSFGQLVYLAIKHLETDPGPITGVKHLLVDEYQDINRSQERLVELLGKNASVFVVGDPRQTIYKWRGSNEELFRSFKSLFVDSVEMSLTENRRSAKSIINVANALGRHMGYAGEQLTSLRKDPGFAGVIEFVSNDEEAQWIAKQIADLVETEKCARYSDIAILVRSVKLSGEPFIKALRKFNIPFVIGGNSGLFQRDEVQAVARLFAWLSYKGFWSVGHGINRGELTGEELFKSAISHWKDATGIEPGAKILMAVKEWKSAAEKGRFKTMIDAYYALLLCLDYTSLDPADKLASIAMANLGRFSSLLSDYDVAINFGGPNVPLSTHFYNLCLFMNFYAAAAYEEYTEDDLSGIDAVQLMTVHQAKGLEWNTVFMPAFMEGKFPQINIGKHQDWYLSEELFDRPRYEGELNDERRLAYVAITRAKQELLISYHIDRTDDKKSRFIDEIKGELQTIKIIDSLPQLKGRGKRDEEMINTFSSGEIIEYIRCPYFYRFRNVWGYKPELAGPMGYGKSLHYCLKLIAKRLMEGKGGENAMEMVKPVFVDNFHLPFADEALKKRLMAKGERVISDFLSKNEADMRKIEDVEVMIEFPLKKATVVGRADVILKSGEKGEIEVRDYKTSDKVITKDESNLQVRLYSIGLQALGKKPVLGSVANLEENDIRLLSVDNEELNKASASAEAAIDGITSKRFDPDPADHCETCDFKRLCAAGTAYLSSKKSS